MTAFADIENYLLDQVRTFEMDAAEDGCYTPNEHERHILEWFAQQIASDDEFADLLAAAYKARSDERAAEGCCRGCGAPPEHQHWGRYAECAPEKGQG